MAKPNNAGGGFQLKATRSDRFDHPDLREDAEPDQRHLMTPQQRADRAYDERYYHDEEFRRAEMERLRPAQERLPADMQRELSGRFFAGTPSEGLRAYENTRRALARQSNTILESQVARMSDAEYDRYFDGRGQIREGYRFVYDRGQGITEIADIANRQAYLSAGYLGPMTKSALHDAETQANNRGGSFVVDRRADVTRPYEDPDA